LRNKQFGCELLTWNQKLWVPNLENWKAEKLWVCESGVSTELKPRGASEYNVVIEESWNC
jgi:hypothetical protein